MNRYNFDEISVGLTESFQVTITEEMVENFCNMTGDINPLHTDEKFAKEKGYVSKVTYGMLTASFLSTLAGVYLPGERSLIHSVESKFVAPVYVGHTLTVSGQVVEKDERFSTFILKTTIVNQEGKKVLRGKMQIGII